MDLASGGALEAAAWKVKNLEDYDERLERAARGVDELAKARETAALVVYEAALMKSGRPADEVRRLVREFEETFEDEEEELTIPHASGIMNVEGDEWFFGDESLRTLTGQLLGQFQHRVAQYNYVNEREVLRRWADSYDTRLFIRRRIYETEPIVGVVAGVDLPLIQFLRVAAGGDTVVPSPEIARALVALAALDEESQGDDYAVLAAAENLALRLELPAPIVGEILHDLAVEDQLEFPEPPSDVTGAETKEATEAEDRAGGTDPESVRPSSDDRAARQAARQEAERGEEPTRIQDPQAKDAPGVRDEGGGERPTPAPPKNEPPESAPGTQDEGS
ncbi:MAG: hypothetical protein QOI57_970 [Rubrobacteraceae bacterium]|nr:hypothetical protein [Rubrobacteraceae bacterium]